MAKTANEPPKYPEIGARLTQFIKDSGEPNPRQFALKAGLAPQLIHNLAAGYSMPGGETLVALAKAFRKFDATWLLTGTASQLPAQVPSKLEPYREGLPTPGEATPQQADFVGRLIERLERELSEARVREAWYQEMLKKPLASHDAAAFMFAEPAAPISLRPAACQPVSVAALATDTCKVVEMYPKREVAAKAA